MEVQKRHLINVTIAIENLLLKQNLNLNNLGGRAFNRRTIRLKKDLKPKCITLGKVKR
jgi:hypothetical protein